jgi:hypothetical protein
MVKLEGRSELKEVERYSMWKRRIKKEDLERAVCRGT